MNKEIEKIFNGHEHEDKEFDKKVVDFSFDLAYKIEKTIEYAEDKEMSDEGFRAYINSIKVDKLHKPVYIECWMQEVLPLLAVRKAMVKNPAIMDVKV